MSFNQYDSYKCNEPYYGGEARCLDAANVSDDYDPVGALAVAVLM